MRQEGAQDAAQAFNAWAIFVLVGVAGVIWFFGRPDGPIRSKLAAVSAAAAGALALLINLGLSQLWFHDRPFVEHPGRTLLLVHHSADNSFPSDHASLAFAIAFAVLAFHRTLGAVFLIGATCVAVDRIFIGVHYPFDVVVSFFVGLASAAVVTSVGSPSVRWTVAQLSRLSDPFVRGATTLFRTRRRTTHS